MTLTGEQLSATNNLIRKESYTFAPRPKPSAMAWWQRARGVTELQWTAKTIRCETCTTNNITELSKKHPKHSWRQRRTNSLTRSQSNQQTVSAESISTASVNLATNLCNNSWNIYDSKPSAARLRLKNNGTNISAILVNNEFYFKKTNANVK